MSVTTGTFPGVRIVDMPDLGSVTDTSSVVGERAGSGRFSAAAMATHAAARTLPWSVKTWGATGNGSTDDSAAIQAAASAAAPHGAIFFPAGIYRITTAITVPPGVSIVGAGPASIIAPATVGQVALDLINSVITDEDAVIQDIQIAPSVDDCIGIRAVFCRYLTVRDCTFTGCAGGSISFDRCEWYNIADCWVRSSMSFLGGTVLCCSSVWNSVTGGFLGGNATISRVRFSPMTNSPFGNADPCIHVVSQPTTDITQCYLAWGAYGAGPVDFIILENQCQGNVLTGNKCLGVNNGITVQPGPMANSVMPTYITMTDNIVDSFGGIGILIAGTATKQAVFYNISGSQITEPQQVAITATVAAGGSGYAVGNVLFGPAVPAAQQGAQVILTVTSVSGGAVTGVSIYNRGLTQTPPANPVVFTGGSGSGATFNLTFLDFFACLWLSNTLNSAVVRNFCGTYGGVRVGWGILLDTVTNSLVADNQAINLGSGVHSQPTGNQAITFTRNFMQNNLGEDFGGSMPTFSIFQDNIGVPWLTTTPAMPASGVAVTNTAPYEQQIFIGGGTVTGINYLGMAVPATTAAPIILTIQRQHTISITYTVAPDWAWIPIP